MSRSQECSFTCDKCKKEKSPVGVNFTEARKSALAKGWVIHPSSGEQQHHFGPKCLTEMLLGVEPSKPLGEAENKSSVR